VFSWFAVSSCSFVTRGREDDFTIGLYRIKLAGTECVAYRDVGDDDEFRAYGWIYDWARICGILAPLCGMLTIALMLLDCCCKVCCSKYMQTFLVICCQFNQAATFLIFASTACLSRKGVGQSDQFAAFCRMGSGSVMSLIAFWCYFIGGFLLCCSPKPDPCNKKTANTNDDDDVDDDDEGGRCNTCCGRNAKEKKSKDEEAPATATTKAEENPQQQQQQQQQEDVPEKKEEEDPVVVAAAAAAVVKKEKEEPIAEQKSVEETKEEENQQEGVNDNNLLDEVKVVVGEVKPDPDEENVEESRAVVADEKTNVSGESRAIAKGDEEEVPDTNETSGEKNVPNNDEGEPRPQSPEPVEAGMEIEFDEEFGTSQVGSKFY